MDALETAHACGMSLHPTRPDEPSLEIPVPPLKAETFEETLNEWFALAYVLNSLNRSMGMPDSYPFKLCTPVLAKLAFVDKVVRAQMKGT
jgi:hypothetical protein